MPPDDRSRQPAVGELAGSHGLGPLPPPHFEMALRLGSSAAPLGEVRWAVRSVTLDEALHTPYALQIHAVAGTTDFDLDELIGARLHFELARREHARIMHGVVQRAELVGDHGDGTRVVLHAGPALALLGHSRRSRVFQDATVVEIVREVAEPLLARYGSAVVCDRLTSAYMPRDYCVQYRESDLEFLLRILSEAGITVLFDHSGDAEQVLLVDDNQELPSAGTDPLERGGLHPPTLPYVPDRSDEVPTESIRALAVARRAGPERWACSVDDWMSRPPVVPSSTTDAEGGHGGPIVDIDEGRANEGPAGEGPPVDDTRHRVALMNARGQAGASTLSATSNATVLRAGSVFELAGPLDEGHGQRWVVTRVRHHGDVPQASVHGRADGGQPQYSNEIVCQPYETRIVPQRCTRPRAQGIYTARVTGPTPKRIHTDRFGRIQVQMLWDERSNAVETRSCWLRVMQPWAGDGFGTVFIPRVGAQVVVSFVDGDPDRPLCMGCVYDGANAPPYPLPESETRTVLRTSSTDGDGFNELSFEDTAGEEEVYLHAQGALREVVRSEHTTTIGGSQRESIGRARVTTVGLDDVVQVGGDGIETIAGNVASRVRGAVQVRISDSPAEPDGARGYAMTVVRGRYTVEAAEAVVLQCGASRLELHPQKIVLSGPEIVARCPNDGAPHETSLAMTTTSLDVVADIMRHRAAVVTTRAEHQVVFGAGPGGQASLMSLTNDGARVHARKAVDVQASTVVVAGTEAATVKGSTCTVEGAIVAVNSERVGIDATGRVEISTPGQVNIRGHERITLN
ncbi:MAG: type VI secretion system tip protein VgrG [Deltaproteobacteria bacterium]|nr:type VI secretion system tip protein VgrG [Deltaproteobacteria bacterium]